jgi:hypothetical protein
MKQAVLVSLFWFAFRPIQAEVPSKEDGWSAAVNGLRARITFGEVRTSSGSRLPEVFVELHNTTDILGVLEFDLDVGKAFRYELATADGKPAPRPIDISMDGHVAGPFRVAIPMRGTLKFPVSWSGYGIRPNYGTIFSLQFGLWEIPADDPNDYLLSATLTVARAEDDRLDRRWHGTIKIPGVKAPTKK